MPTIIGIDHIYITVTDMERSAGFYDPLMEILGFRKNRFILSNEEHIQYYNQHFAYVLRPAQTHSKHNSCAPGLHHLCLRVESTEEVQDIANSLTEKGIATCEAKLYPEYAADYFAIFFYDPDGIQLEITNYRQERRQRHDQW